MLFKSAVGFLLRRNDKLKLFRFEKYKNSQLAKSPYLFQMYQNGFHTYYIYIITNKTKSVLYVGVTNYLAKRLFQHAENIRLNKKTFASKYKCKYLLYYEKYTWIQKAISREKEIKGWRREKKITLIKTINPHLNFLEYLFPYDDM